VQGEPRRGVGWKGVERGTAEAEEGEGGGNSHHKEEEGGEKMRGRGDRLREENSLRGTSPFSSFNSSFAKWRR